MARFRLLSGQALAPSCIHAISQFLDRRCVVIGIFAALDGLKPRPNVTPKRFQAPVAFDKKAQPLPHDFTGSLIHARGHLLVYDLLKFLRQRDVHKASVALRARNVKNGYLQTAKTASRSMAVATGMDSYTFAIKRPSAKRSRDGVLRMRDHRPTARAGPVRAGERGRPAREPRA